MSDVSWSIDTSPDGTVTATEVLGNPPTIQRAETINVRVGFDTETPYTTLREYLDFAGNVATMKALDGTAYYRELHTDTEELLLGFNPDGADMPSAVPGFWGVLTGGRDVTRPTMTGFTLDLQMFVLAEYSDHADRAAAKTAHEK